MALKTAANSRGRGARRCEPCCERGAATPTTGGPAAGSGSVSYNALLGRGVENAHVGAGIRELFAFEIPPIAK